MATVSTVEADAMAKGIIMKNKSKTLFIFMVFGSFFIGTTD